MYHGSPPERAELRDTKMREELLLTPLSKKKDIPGGTGKVPVFPVVSTTPQQNELWRYPSSMA